MRGLLASQEWDKVNRAAGLAAARPAPPRPKARRAADQDSVRSVILTASEVDLDDGERLLESFTRLAEPLAIDPRLEPILGDRADLTRGRDARMRVTTGLNTFSDLETIPAFSPAERPLAQAMVWNRVAELYRDEADELE